MRMDSASESLASASPPKVWLAPTTAPESSRSSDETAPNTEPVSRMRVLTGRRCALTSPTISEAS